MSSIVNKIKEAVHSDKHSAPEGTHGPHHSHAANAADPRVDSDRDHSATLGGTHNAAHISSGTHAPGRTGFNDGPAPNTAGHHTSDVLNKADPRVDSDRDGQHNIGMAPQGHNVHSGFGSGPAPNTAGFHQSDMANKADPRIDSDRDGSRNMGAAQPAAHGGSHNAGLAGSHINTGPAAHTAGPHKSDVLNKADPRVDSDVDGSKTYGTDKTFAQS